MKKVGFGVLLCLVCSLALPGCIFPIGIVAITPSHRRSSQARTVVGLEGYDLVLESGEPVKMAGLDFSQVDPLLAEYMQDELSYLTRDTTVLVDPAGGGAMRICRIETKTKKESNWIGSLFDPTADMDSPGHVPIVGLIPIVVFHVPLEEDLNAKALSMGLGGPDLDSLEDGKLRKAYAAAADCARQKGIGIWMSPGAMVAFFAKNRDGERLSAMLKRGADVNGRYPEDGRPALVCAAGSGYDDSIPIVKALLAAGADINLTDPHGNTPLHAAALAGGTEICRILINYGAKVDAVNHYGANALSHALAPQSPDVWVGVSPNDETIELLLDAGVSAKGADLSTLVGQSHRYDPESSPKLIRRLLASGAPLLNSYEAAEGQFSLLTSSIEGEQPEIVKTLLQAGADPNFLDGLGDRPLTKLASMRYLDHRMGMARLLVEAGADPTLKDGEGKNAIEWAQGNGYKGLADYLRKVAQARQP